jgi:hypothetical protein
VREATPKRTLVIGLSIIVVFAALAGVLPRRGDFVLAIAVLASGHRLLDAAEPAPAEGRSPAPVGAVAGIAGEPAGPPEVVLVRETADPGRAPVATGDRHAP